MVRDLPAHLEIVDLRLLTPAMGALAQEHAVNQLAAEAVAAAAYLETSTNVRLNSVGTRRSARSAGLGRRDLAYGSSALPIAEALVSRGPEGASHVITDAFQGHVHEPGRDGIIAAGLSGLCSLLRELSQLALTRLIADGVEADAAFADGSHNFHGIFVDLVFFREPAHPGGLIILDDCASQSVPTAVREVRTCADLSRIAGMGPV